MPADHAAARERAESVFDPSKPKVNYGELASDVLALLADLERVTKERDELLGGLYLSKHAHESAEAQLVEARRALAEIADPPFVARDPAFIARAALAARENT